jgi:ribosome-associated protein|tara:strand:- start:58 stop:591 length:534 start_codon:yes stop_codon:yes gene_type:complete
MENETKFDDALDDSDEIEIVSKTQLKRESIDIQKLGMRLVGMSYEQLAKIPLDEHVLEAIALAKKIQNKRSALKRHYQFLGKLLRARETDAIIEALRVIEEANHGHIQRFHQAEMWRDEIIAKGNEAIESLVDQQTAADRQKLRQLSRNYASATKPERQTAIARLIYKEVLLGIDNS